MGRAAGDSAPRKVRKGTRSCAACRKCKLRCAWTSEAAQRCRRCEERHLECIPQTLSTPSSSRRPRTTPDRIASLEQQVEVLARALQASHEGGVLVPVPTDHGIPNGAPRSSASCDSDASEADPSIPDAAIPTQPSYLSALFNNSLLITARSDDSDKGHTLPSHLCDLVRSKLQSIIPHKEDLALVANQATGCIHLMSDLCPAVTTINSDDELWSRYEEINHPTASPWTLASWLLTVALTVVHTSGARLRTRSAPNVRKSGFEYSCSVATAVDQVVVSCDELIGSIKGIETAVLLTRLYMTLGSLSKSFMLIRRTVAASELIGLPRMDDGPSIALWRMVCSAERLQSLVFACPSATQHYCRPTLDPIFDNGVFIPINFLFRLSGVMLSIGGLDDTHSMRASLAEHEDTCLRLGNQLHSLAAEIPSSWWSAPDLAHSIRLVQYIYHYVTIRVHLPLVLQRNTSVQSGQSREACSKACKDLLESYLGMYSVLPEGSFIHRITNFPVFTAAIILILSEHSAFVPEDQQHTGSFPSPASMDLVSRVTQAIEHNLERAGSSSTTEIIFGIRALTQLLSRRTVGQDQENVFIRVPLLGKLNVRRNEAPPSIFPSGQLILPQPTQDEAYNLPIDDDPLNQLAAAPLCWSIEDAYQMLFLDRFEFL